MSDQEVVQETSSEPVEENVIVSDLSFDQLVQEVLEGKWGQGQEQRQRLAEAGYNHNEVHKEVNRLRNQR